MQPREEIVRDIMKRSEVEFNQVSYSGASRVPRTLGRVFSQLVENIYGAHRLSRHGYDEDAPLWDFTNSLFFTTTMLTSIGYGYVVPITEGGRFFGVLYCLIGMRLSQKKRVI